MTFRNGCLTALVFLQTQQAEASPVTLPQVVFEDSASDLPQDQIQAQILREIEALPEANQPERVGRITVGRTTDGQIRLEYLGDHGSVERLLQKPADDASLTLLVGLAAVNLVSSESARLLAEMKGQPESSPSTKPEATQAPSPKDRTAEATLGTSDALRAKPGVPWRMALHGGWWDAGLDVTSPQGVFLGVGVPWILYLPFLRYGGQEGLVALDARLGYALRLSGRTALYGELLTAWSYDWGDPCGNGCTSQTHKLYFFPVAGLRHRFSGNGDRHHPASGVMVGIDLALAVASVHHIDDPNRSGWIVKNIPALVGVAFSQVYVGYEW